MGKGKDSGTGKVFLIIGISFLLIGMAFFVGFYVGITKKIKDARGKKIIILNKI
jgi:hypothetical protein